MALGELNRDAGEPNSREVVLNNFYPNLSQHEALSVGMGKTVIIENPIVERLSDSSAIIGRNGDEAVVIDSHSLFYIGKMRLVKSTDEKPQYGLLMDNDPRFSKSYLFVFPPEGQESLSPGRESNSVKEYMVSLAELMANGISERYGDPGTSAVELLRQDIDMGNRVDVLSYIYRLGQYNADISFQSKDFDAIAAARSISELRKFDRFDDPIAGGYRFKRGLHAWALDTGLPCIKGAGVKVIRSEGRSYYDGFGTEDDFRTPTEVCVQLLAPYKGRFHPAISYDKDNDDIPVIGLDCSEKVSLRSVQFPDLSIRRTYNGTYKIYLEQLTEIITIQYPPEQGVVYSETDYGETLDKQSLDWYLRSLAVVGNGHIYKEWGDPSNIALTQGLDLSRIEHVLTLLGRQAQFIHSYYTKGDLPFNRVKTAARIARGPVIDRLDDAFTANHGNMKLDSYTDWKLGAQERPVEIGGVTVTSTLGERLQPGSITSIAELKALERERTNLFEMTDTEIGKVSNGIRKIEQRYRKHLLGKADSFPSHSQLAKDLDELIEIISDPRSSRNAINQPSEYRATREGLSDGRLFQHYESEYRVLEPIPEEHAATIREESVRLASALFRKMVEINAANPLPLRKSGRQLLFDHAPLRAAIYSGTGGRIINDDEHYSDLYSAFWELFPNFDQSISRWAPVFETDPMRNTYSYNPNPDIVEYADFLKAIGVQGDTILNAPYPTNTADENQTWGISMFGQQILPDTPLSVVLPVTASFMRIIATSMAIYPNFSETYQRLDTEKSSILMRDREIEIQRILELLGSSVNEENARLFIDEVGNMRYSASVSNVTGESMLLSEHYLIKAVFDRLREALTSR